MLDITDAFNLGILRDIDVQVYGAPHTQIGLNLAKSASSASRNASQGGWALAGALFFMGVAVAGLGAAVDAHGGLPALAAVVYGRKLMATG